MSRAIHYIGRKTYDELCAEMAAIAIEYKGEAVDLPNNSAELFEFVRKIPFLPEKVETLKAPSVTIADGGDCDDKTIVVCAWALARKCPCRITLAGVKEEPGRYHHVFPELFINGAWIPYDATYSYCIIGKTLPSYNVFKSFEVKV
jgi:hypothetical protein